MDRSDKPGRDEEDVGRLVRAAGPREQLPEELKLRWEEHFRRELGRAGARRKGRRRFALAVAAGVAVVAVLLLSLPRPPVHPVPAMRVAALNGTVELALPDGSIRELAAGQPLAMHSAIRTGPDGLVALNWAGYDLRLNRNTRVTLGREGIYLDEGAVYASDDENRIVQLPLHIETRHGRISDIGTQFTVFVRDDSTVTTVRRGLVSLEVGGVEHRAEARPGRASRITVDRQRQVRTRQVAPGGEGWQWIYEASPGFDLEGHSAWEFLRWSTRESGLRLVFATHTAEHRARTTTLHGDIGEMNPESAVTPVLATTELSAVVSEGRLLVSLRRQPRSG